MPSIFNRFDAVVAVIVLLSVLGGARIKAGRCLLYVASIVFAAWAAAGFVAQTGVKFYFLFLVCFVALAMLADYVADMLPDVINEKLSSAGGAAAGVLLGFLLAVTLVVPLAGKVLVRGRDTVTHSFTVARCAASFERVCPGFGRFDIAYYRAFRIDDILRACGADMSQTKDKIIKSNRATMEKIRISENAVP